jgi:hypothetical protein
MGYPIRTLKQAKTFSQQLPITSFFIIQASFNVISVIQLEQRFCHWKRYEYDYIYNENSILIFIKIQMSSFLCWVGRAS